MHYPSAASSPHKIRKTIGIDLGTTNSVIAFLDLTDSTLITGVDERGRMTFPSVVGYNPEHNRVVSGRAAQALKTLPDATALPLSSVKRFMGLDRAFLVGPIALQPPPGLSPVPSSRRWLARSRSKSSPPRNGSPLTPSTS